MGERLDATKGVHRDQGLIEVVSNNATNHREHFDPKSSKRILFVSPCRSVGAACAGVAS